MGVQELLTSPRQTISQEEWRLRVDLAGVTGFSITWDGAR